MTYLLSQIIFSLLLAVIGGAAIGWIIHGYKAHQRERSLRTALERQAAATAHAQQERQMIADDFDDMKLGLESKLGEVQFENRQIPKLQENLAKSQQIVQQMIKKHDAEISELAAHNNELHGQIEVQKLRLQELSESGDVNDEAKGNTSTATRHHKPGDASISNTRFYNAQASDTGSDHKSKNTVVTDNKKTNSPDDEITADYFDSEASKAKASSTDVSENSKDTPLDANLKSETHVQNELFALEDEIEDIRHSETDLFGALSDLSEDELEMTDEFQELSNDDSSEIEQPATTNQSESIKIKSSEKEDSNASFVTSAGGDPDDLKNIHGIGPVIEQSLNDIGITNYQQIASLTRHQIEEIAEILKIFPGRIEHDNWVGSAKRLIKNDNELEASSANSEKEIENA